ncbi:hypothetical protein [Nautilia sp.]
MRITSNLSFQSDPNSSFQNPLKDPDVKDRQIVKKILSQVPDKDLQKILNELNKIPIDENRLKTLLNKTQLNPCAQNSERFSIYA